MTKGVSLSFNEQLEPEAADHGVTPTEKAMISTAISLKRIADAITECDSYGFTGVNSIASAISRGLAR